MNPSESDRGMLTETRITLKNVGKIRPDSIDDYIASGGYATLRKALTISRVSIINDLVTASLRGRGGAGFSAGLKEKFTREASTPGRPTYLVCNADEGEPGTFKDRIIMENDPHILIEGLLIASYAIGAEKAFVYIRAEYYRSIEMVCRAIEAATARGYIGANIAGSAISISVELRLGAGSYLCGEELALLESLEGKRGYPRIKPPFPAEVGLYGQPTLVNNVETLATIPAVIEKGPEWYLRLGTADTPGTKIFTLTGDIEKPGYYEVELGATIRDLIYVFGGGIRGGREMQAVLLGGAAGTFVDASALDTPLGFDSLRPVGAVLGSGAIIVLAEGRSIPEMTKSILEFFEHESCGKCVPCRVGMTVLVQQMQSIIDGGVPGGDDHGERTGNGDTALEAMVAEAEYMARTSLCPLGQSPILPLRSLQRYFADEFRR